MSLYLTELCVILLLIIILFGPGEMPTFGKTFSQGIKDIKKKHKPPAKKATTPAENSERRLT